ncbi:hypothetical protein [Spirosoma utsteinense]|uniref:Beta-carotene 15,15'-monooxygenase n=1 Tax=Spirosoma utsteinense TaxID=2585773 RepID=A0ABR6WB64_9BACT|nr:hypothetical protein [Spirosoma utsteinense]MBC3786467.1 hypothetical protein [Spirosoma utsteinense]MBC3793820.1 hypothetical protein [Spirosoma utsteinense]
MNALSVSFRQTLRLLRLVGLLYGVTLVLSLLAALPLYNTLKGEDQNSLAFMNLLNGFDYTIFSDFMRRSGPAISPLMSVGRWLGVLYLFMSVFTAGGILWCFSPAPALRSVARFQVAPFLSACSHYVGRFIRLFGVTLLFVLVGAGIWLVIGTLVSMMLSDTMTERGVFWVGLTFFALFVLTATLLLCIGDYAKVLMFSEDEHTAFRAFGRAGRLVLHNLGQTYGRYWLLIGIGTGLFGLYFLLEDLIPMNSWLTILLMFVVQQALVFARVGLKVWSLGTAYSVYMTLPKPVSPVPPTPVAEPVFAQQPTADPDQDQSGSTLV